jgi:hypothetical protein
MRGQQLRDGTASKWFVIGDENAHSLPNYRPVRRARRQRVRRAEAEQ